MSRYLVSFYAQYIFLSYVSVQADDEDAAEKQAREARKHRGWDDSREYRVEVEKI